MGGLLEQVASAFEQGGIDLGAWGLAWARVTPAVTLVPAFGLRALPAPARATMGLALALAIAPALGPVLPRSGAAWPWAFVAELGKGLPVALTAAVMLWVATMAGGLVDDLRGARGSSELPVLEQGATPTGALLALLVAIAFLEGGGPARVAASLARPGLDFAGPLERAAASLSSGIQLAVAVATPVIIASIVIEVASALVARAASPAFVQPLLAPLRSLALLGIAALVLERVVALLALGAAAAP